MELLLGCGSARDRRIPVNGKEGWTQLVTLDHNPDHAPDVVHDLEVVPYPFDDDTFDEVHAYEVLEHLGGFPGDWRSFCRDFSELWRILKPGGYLAATCPSWRSIWAFADPSHRRVICNGSLVFLSQFQYALQIGRTTMSDFRRWYHADFTVASADLETEARGDGFAFVLQAVKPARAASELQGVLAALEAGLVTVAQAEQLTAERALRTSRVASRDDA